MLFFNLFSQRPLDFMIGTWTGDLFVNKTYNYTYQLTLFQDIDPNGLYGNIWKNDNSSKLETVDDAFLSFVKVQLNTETSIISVSTLSEKQTIFPEAVNLSYKSKNELISDGKLGENQKIDIILYDNKIVVAYKDKSTTVDTTISHIIDSSKDSSLKMLVIIIFLTLLIVGIITLLIIIQQKTQERKILQEKYDELEKQNED